MNKDDLFNVFLFAFLVLIALPIEICIAASLKISDLGMWLGYYGAIFGGAITLVGVYWTIINQDKHNQDSLSIQYKPILEFSNFVEARDTCHRRELGISVNGFGGYNYSNVNSENLDKFVCNIVFKNIGRGETYNAYINRLEVKENAAFKNFIYPMSGRCSIGEILPDHELLLRFSSVPYLLVDKEYFNNNVFADLTTIIHIEFSDVFSVYKYDLAVYFTWKVIFNKSDFEDLGGTGHNIVASRCIFDVGNTQVMPTIKFTKMI